MSLRLSLAGLVVSLPAGVVLAQSNPIPAKIPIGPGTVSLQQVVTGFTSPVFMANAPGDSSRTFVVEQPGQIKIVQNGSILPTPFLSLTAGTDVVPMRTGYDERGLLGLAFDPNFNNPASAGFHRIFTWESEPLGPTPTYPLATPGSLDHLDALTSYKVSTTDANQVDPSTRTVLLTIEHPEFNHDSGTLAFGPDGYLYFGDGDGGGANDTNSGTNTGHNPSIGNAQDLNSPLGKIHRIDVYGTNRGNYGIPADNPFVNGAVPEVYAYGFRNPYRFSFDGNKLIVADVGQNNVEEVDDVTKGGNYGWRYKEGTFAFNNVTGDVSTDLSGIPSGLTDPLVEYDHDEGIAIVGGFVYHGSKLPWLDGKYVFGDFSQSFSSPTGRLFYADLGNGTINQFALANFPTGLGMFVKGIGQGPDGELYVLTSTVLGPTGTTGGMFEIVPEPASLGMMGACMLLLVRRRGVRGK